MTQTRRQFAYLAHLRNLATVAAAIADGDMPTAPELAALVGVDERTIYRYLTMLREFGAPLPASPGNRDGYRFTRRWDFGGALLRWLKRDNRENP